MSDDDVDTVAIAGWADRLRQGDRAAADELLRRVGGRLERLARKMLQRFPAVSRWAETGDILQNSLLRLFRALQEVRPTSVRDFFGLAAEQMRREAIDLARHFHGPQGLAANHHSGEVSQQAASAEHDELERWSAFHEAVPRLPAKERVVLDLIYYNGWTQAAVAEQLGVSVRTVQRRLESALLFLHQAIGPHNR